MECRVLIVNDSRVDASETVSIRDAFAASLTAVSQTRAEVEVRDIEPPPSAKEFERIKTEVLAWKPHCILVDGHLDCALDNGLHVVRKLRCVTEFRRFVWLWTGHTEQAVRSLFVDVAPWLFQGVGSGARSSAGDLGQACVMLAQDVAEAWVANGRSFDLIGIEYGCLDAESLAFELLNDLQMGLWSAPSNRKQAWETAWNTWAGPKGLRAALTQPREAPVDVRVLEQLVKDVSMDDGRGEVERLARWWGPMAGWRKRPPRPRMLRAL